MQRMTPLLAIGAAVLAFLAAVFFLQNRLLYFPSSATIEGIAVEGLQPWPDAAAFRGLLAEPRRPRRESPPWCSTATPDTPATVWPTRALPRLGVRVILAEYPGYGPRDGSPGEETLVDDAARPWRWRTGVRRAARRRRRIARRRRGRGGRGPATRTGRARC